MSDESEEDDDDGGSFGSQATCAGHVGDVRLGGGRGRAHTGGATWR